MHGLSTILADAATQSPLPVALSIIALTGTIFIGVVQILARRVESTEQRGDSKQEAAAATEKKLRDQLEQTRHEVVLGRIDRIGDKFDFTSREVESMKSDLRSLSEKVNNLAIDVAKLRNSPDSIPHAGVAA